MQHSDASSNGAPTSASNPPIDLTAFSRSDPTQLSTRQDRVGDVAALLAQLPEPAPVTVAVSDLTLYPPYGRMPSVARLERLRAAWSPAAMGALITSKRSDGSIMVIDGGHRGTVAREKGPGAVITLQYDGLSIEEEALVYHALNDALPQTAADKFRGRLAYGDALATSIAQQVSDVGFGLGLTSHVDGKLRCVAALQDVATHYGVGHLYPVLRTFYRAYDGDARACRDYAIKAMAAFLKGYAGLVDVDRLVDQMRAKGWRGMHGEANTLRLKHSGMIPMNLAYTYTLRDVYNANLKARKLPAWSIERIKGHAVDAGQPRKTTSRRQAAWNERIGEASGRPS